MIRRLVLGTLLGVLATNAHSATNRPRGYVTICKIGQTCPVGSNVKVAFGASGYFLYKTLSGTFSCSVATFGSDPIPSKSVKECSVPTGSTTDPAPAPTPTGITGSSCATNGTRVVVNATISVTSGVYDGGCKRFTAGSALGDGSQSESQSPLFRVQNGATLRNVVIGENGADGIHVYNGGVLDNIHWINVGEDAMTIKSSGTVTVRNIEGYDAEDKFFQVNAPATLNVSNCIVHRAGKILRQNGGTTYKIAVTMDSCDFDTLNEGVFRTDSPASTARLTDSRLHSAGKVCIGPWASCTQSGNVSY